MEQRWASWLGPLDARRCELEVLTFKEGVLSAVAHDLRLRVARLRGECDAARVKVVVEASSVELVCARSGGRDAPEALGERDRRKIESTLRSEVLQVARHPEITFESTRIGDGAAGLRVEGMLGLHGVRRPLAIDLREEGGRLVGQVAIHQPDFGIAPYQALLGTLKVQPRVEVRISLAPVAGGSPAPGAGPR